MSRSVAWSKAGGESFSSFEERTLDGSAAELWILKSPATRYEYSTFKRAD